MFIGRIINETTLNVLKKGVEGTLERHKAIANNIANVDTPNYERATVGFEKQLKRALDGQGFAGSRLHSSHFIIGGPEEIPMVRPRVVIDKETRFRADSNNINIDQEMADLALNTQRNEVFTEFLKRRYSGIKSLIQSAGA